MEHLKLIEIVASMLFVVALLHTFLASRVERLAHCYPNHAGLFHLLGEVEVVFEIVKAGSCVHFFLLINLLNLQ